MNHQKNKPVQKTDKPKWINRQTNQKKVEKLRWLNPVTNDLVPAAGILFYSSDSFWVVEEKIKFTDIRGKYFLSSEADRGASEYNDIGGKYSSDDGNIYATIRRELYEETYGMIDVLVSDIKKFAEKYGMKRIAGVKGACAYLCICVPITDICDLCQIKEEDFEQNFSALREKTIAENPKAVYKQRSIKKIKYSDVAAFNIGYRLRFILKQLFIKDLPKKQFENAVEASAY